MLELTLFGPSNFRVAILRADISAIMENASFCRVVLKSGALADVQESYKAILKQLELQ